MNAVFNSVYDEKAFWVSDGIVVHNLYELAFALGDMKKSIFKKHVNKHKNDFYEWINNTLQDEELAKKFVRVITKDKAEIIVLRHIARKLAEIKE